VSGAAPRAAESKGRQNGSKMGILNEKINILDEKFRNY
jgi:hypothetical protein